jgi:D-arabinose 5-phosphate isomerase GutQ
MPDQPLSDRESVAQLAEAVVEGAAHLLELIRPATGNTDAPDLPGRIIERTYAISSAVEETIRGSRTEVAAAVDRFAWWMRDGTTVRVLGAGRARLAAAIPANRLAHGGAHVFLQDSMIPMPHSVRGGGIIAASASGSTAAVLDVMRSARTQAPNIEIVGIAAHSAEQFASLCHLFIGIRIPSRPHLSALADLEEYVISEVLDALVVAAGQQCGYDERAWRLGHENLGATGPYDARKLARDLYFTS